MYNYMTKLYSKQIEVIKNHLSTNVRAIGQEKPSTGSIRGLNFAVVGPATVQVIDCRFGVAK
jgi:hypothetical protein